MRSDELITIAGKRGYGKTTAAKTLISKLIRVIIWDPMNEYKEFPNRYIPSTGSIEEFNRFLKFYWDQGNIFIFVDEADQVLPEGRPLCEYGGKIVNLGRHKNIGMGTITRRIALLNKTVVSQAQELILFHTFIPNDIRYLNEFIIGADQLRTLPKYKFKTYRM